MVVAAVSPEFVTVPPMTIADSEVNVTALDVVAAAPTPVAADVSVVNDVVTSRPSAAVKATLVPSFVAVTPVAALIELIASVTRPRLIAASVVVVMLAVVVPLMVIVPVSAAGVIAAPATVVVPTVAVTPAAELLIA